MYDADDDGVVHPLPILAASELVEVGHLRIDLHRAELHRSCIHQEIGAGGGVEAYGRVAARLNCWRIRSTNSQLGACNSVLQCIADALAILFFANVL
ncbi:MAG: hypothetical protein IPN76_30945 [Saprospiraceae bacterium]|nr:hypothetical protein [Saprospiraceae bacterium]